jgi:hypothetical protein
MDPRKDDYPEDSEEWQVLLALSKSESIEVYEALRYFRLGGAKLEYDDGVLLLRPRFIRPEHDPSRATVWEDGLDWRTDLEGLLEPHRDELNSLFQTVRKSLQDGQLSTT